MGERRWGLALGGGGLYGFAHLGVLQVLKEAGLQPAYVSGTSAGSIVASLYACGFMPAAIERLVSTTLGQLLFQNHGPDFSSLAIKGFIPGGLIEKALDTLASGKLVKDAYIPLFVEAVDINSGRLVVFAGSPLPVDTGYRERVLWLTDAKISTAVRASIAIPGVFWPKELDGMQLVDGAILDMVPVRSLWLAEVSPIVAVDIGSYVEKPAEPNSLYSILTRAFGIQARELTLKSLAECANLVIRPALEDLEVWSLSGLSKCIERGKEATREKLDELTELLSW
ncbi:MAG: patatin-like phospholipase family protein [Bacillota bacterium]